jgi:hypothetical protein
VSKNSQGLGRTFILQRSSNTTAEVGAVKNSAVLVNEKMAGRVAPKIQNIRCIKTPARESRKDK